MNPLREASRLGQNLWLDNLSRTLLKEGILQRLIEDDGISGVTSNPSIFQKAVAESPYYQTDLAALKASTPDPEARYEALVIPDIQAACDLLRTVYDKTGGDSGYVSLEVSPKLAADEAGTVAAGLRLKQAVNRDNLLIKVPSTPAGIRAVERLIGLGVSVNVTLMFSLHHEMEVAQAYVRGIRHFIANGGDARKVKSVASIFLSRVDTLVDKKLEQNGTPEAMTLRGKSAVAMCKLAYQRYKDIFHGPAFAELAAKGARPQYPLWASTGTKNPAYSDVMYVEPLIGPQSINTLPDATIAAFRDHGKAAATLEQNVGEAKQHYLALERIGIDMNTVGEQLQEDGVKLFADSFDKLLQQVA